MGRVLPVALIDDSYLVCGDLALLAGHGDDLVSRRLDRSRLVDVDMAALGGDHALVGAQRGGYDREVGLCAADEEMYVGVGHAAELPYVTAGRLAVRVLAVTRRLFHVCGGEPLQYKGVGPLAVVAFKTDHLSHLD